MELNFYDYLDLQPKLGVPILMQHSVNVCDKKSKIGKMTCNFCLVFYCPA